MTHSSSNQHVTHSLLSRFDVNLTILIGHIPQVFAPLMRLVSFVGQPITVIAVGVVVGTAGWLKGYRRIAYAEVGTAAALGVNAIIKNLVHRPRPDTIYAHHMKVHSYSFPSGHAFGSMVFYGLLAYLACLHLPRPWNVLVAGLLALLIFLIGVSRVYLGAHFPSDVAIGWLLGAVSLVLIIKLIKP